MATVRYVCPTCGEDLSDDDDGLDELKDADYECDDCQDHHDA